MCVFPAGFRQIFFLAAEKKNLEDIPTNHET
jgi:hypothetical protein